MFARVLGAIIIVFIAGGSFVYGVGVGTYKWAPFDTLLLAKRSLEGVGLNEYKFSSVAGRDDVLVFDASREEIECPIQNERTGVLVAFGQSNSANYASHRFMPEDVPNVINWYNGNCFRAQSPLLGATNTGGEWISRASEFLVENGTYDEVVVVSLGIGGSPVAAWGAGSELNRRLIETLKEISEIYAVTDMVWHQGESDLNWGVGQSQYFSTFESLHNSIRTFSIEAPLFISVASYCNGGEYPNNITKAQQDLANRIDGVQLGVNTDLLVTSGMRHDDCHFNLQGQNAAAMELAEIISHFHGSN